MGLTAAVSRVVRVPGEVFGDTWWTAEAPDRSLYAIADDTRGFGGTCSSNLAVHKLAGDPPHLGGTTINPMTSYGSMCETGPDRGHWKANGIAAVGNSLYVSVSRHHYMKAPFWQQESWDSSLVRSDDGGASWTSVPKLEAAMFPGPNFATPSFIDYGPDPSAGPHGAAEYVYALSTMGHWNNGHAMTLGRVPRDRIDRLDPRDWQFAHGFDPNPVPDLADPEAGDTAREPVWDRRHDSALPVFQAPGRTSMAGATWVGPLGRYLLPQWHFPALERSNPQRWQHSRWQIYSAPAPWGPWSLFFEHDFAPEGFYNPSVPSRFISGDGTRIWLLTCGDFSTHAYYALHAVEVVLAVDEPHSPTQAAGRRQQPGPAKGDYSGERQ